MHHTLRTQVSGRKSIISMWSELESSLREWILDMWDRKVFVPESIIKEKAKR